MKQIALVIGLLLCVVGTPVSADDAALCPLSGGPGSIAKVDRDHDFFDNDPNSTPADTGNCCRNLDTFKCDVPADISPAVLAGKRNIVVVVADDQGYCQYGFMYGYCATDSGQGRAGKDCRSNIDCAGGQCLRRDSGLSAGAPLRLSDFTCRYRQPPVASDRSTKSCRYKGADGDDTDPFPDVQPDPLGSRGGDKVSFPFHASNFPCTTTYEGGVVPAHPVPLTPYLDQLATHGAVFTRAYVGGNACKSSRPVILYGKPHRHLLEMMEDEQDTYSIASWLLDNGQHTASPPGASGYWPFMLGKAEVMQESSAGFKGGQEKSKTNLAKYHCVNPENCRAAAEAQWPGADFLKVPYDARARQYGIGDALNVIEGRRVVNFTDHGVIARDDLVGGSATRCDSCGTDHGSSGCDASRCGSRLMKPFFLWFAPNQPHKRGRGDDYEALYSGLEEGDMQHSARVTQMDQAVGTLIDELKRHCICGRTLDAQTGDPVVPTRPQKQSLWEHTVLIYLADQGFLLPDAKRNDTENTQRTVLFVSEPKHRMQKSDGSPTLPARSYPDELVHAIDVFRTVLDYANLPFTNGDGDPIEPGVPTESSTGAGYRYGRSLKAWVSNATVPTTHVRDVVFGEDAAAGEIDDDVVRPHNRNRYLVTRPGLLGLCLRTSDGAAEETGPITYDAITGYQKRHARPCVLGAESDCGSGYTCEARGRCVNDPSKACTDNGDCVEADFCDGRCKYDPDGSLGDMGRPVEPQASGDGAQDLESPACDQSIDCVPAAVSLCQPPIFKLEAGGSVDPNAGVLESAWDLNWDPDERHNLLAEDGTYFGDVGDASSLAGKVMACLDNYWKVDVDGATFQWKGSYASSACTWVETALP